MEYRDTMRRYASATSLPINKQPRHPRQRASEVGHASSRLSRMVNCAGLKGWKGGGGEECMGRRIEKDRTQCSHAGAVSDWTEEWGRNCDELLPEMRTRDATGM